jgi:hypothetical protein
LAGVEVWAVEGVVVDSGTAAVLDPAGDGGVAGGSFADAVVAGVGAVGVATAGWDTATVEGTAETSFEGGEV